MTRRNFENTVIAVLVLIGMVALFTTRADAQVPTCAPLGTSTPIPWNEARITWVVPVTNTDGSALSPSTVTTTVYRRTGTTGTFAAVCATAVGAAGASLPNQPVGSQNYVATARVGTGPESVQSNVAVKNVVVTPSPPTSLAILADLTAWAIDETTDRVFFVAVGNVAPGTQCDSTQAATVRGQTLNVVPRDSVTFVPGAGPQVVFASCG